MNEFRSLIIKNYFGPQFLASSVEKNASDKNKQILQDVNILNTLFKLYRKLLINLLSYN